MKVCHLFRPRRSSTQWTNSLTLIPTRVGSRPCTTRHGDCGPTPKDGQDRVSSSDTCWTLGCLFKSSCWTLTARQLRHETLRGANRKLRSNVALRIKPTADVHNATAAITSVPHLQITTV